MILNLKSYILIIAIQIFLFQAISNAQLVYTGIEKGKVNQVYAEQKNINWIWAASVQFVLNNYNVKISQEDIIKRSFHIYDPYDSLPNFQMNFSKIVNRLNNWIIKYKRKKYLITAKLVDESPTPKFLYDELKSMRPVILFSNDSLNALLPFICTAVGFIPGYYGPVPNQLMIRSTLPSCLNDENDEYIIWDIKSLPQRISHYCIISVKQKK